VNLFLQLHLLQPPKYLQLAEICSNRVVYIKFYDHTVCYFNKKIIPFSYAFELAPIVFVFINHLNISCFLYLKL